MPKINVLPREIYELIAAGEVVERPSSAVKELLENSVDAGADSITLEIKAGGIKYIRITDNGCGIAREDVRNAFTGHATSKITVSDDLDCVATLGFRGEALASIAAVSRVEMFTRTAEEGRSTTSPAAISSYISLGNTLILGIDFTDFHLSFFCFLYKFVEHTHSFNRCECIYIKGFQFIDNLTACI